SGQHVPTQKPILELNPDHRMIKHLKDEQDSARFEDWSRILLDQAILAEGGQLEDPASFVQRFNKLLLALTER
ncbi:MAG TPA: molecular chaperone HtpG, partial [Gammaproteobacteria bacterium]|nr:molecular chaperone HtpG [Gammaproteobacteria bacterium]